MSSEAYIQHIIFTEPSFSYHLERFAVFNWKHFPPQHPWFHHKSHNHYVIKCHRLYYTLSTSRWQSQEQQRLKERGLNICQKNERWSSQRMIHLKKMGCVEAACIYQRCFSLCIQSAYMCKKDFTSWPYHLSYTECVLSVQCVCVFFLVPLPEGNSRKRNDLYNLAGEKTAKLTWWTLTFWSSIRLGLGWTAVN